MSKPMPDDGTSARHRTGGSSPPEPPGDIQSPILAVPAAQKYLGGIGYTMLYDLMAKGEIEFCRLGGRRFVTRRSCDAYIARNTGRPVDDDASAHARKAARASVRSRKQREQGDKRKLVPGKLRARHAPRVSAAKAKPAAATKPARPRREDRATT